MFELYNEAARRLLFFARYEASEAGARSIESEHLLLGLTRACDGPVHGMLTAAGLEPYRLQSELRVQAVAGPRVPMAVEMPFGASTSRVLKAAASAASSLRQPFIGPEHLLLGMLEVPDSVAARVLNANGVTREGMLEALAAAAASPATPPDRAAILSCVARVERLLDELFARPGDYEAQQRVAEEMRATLALLKQQLEA